MTFFEEGLTSKRLYSLPQELDFEREASNIHRVTEYFKNVKNTPVVIPKG